MKKQNGFIPLDLWFEKTIDKPVIIAGPCSAENREQVLDTAKGIADCKHISIFRAGVWKPRTKPASFEGMGEIAFQWLKEVKKEYGFKIAVEVAQPEHVYKCFENEVDIVWIGARTTSNPFSVQQIANALNKKDIPVLIKNPVNPDLDTWIGAIERIYYAGIKRIAAVHRGFYPFERTNLRNIPKWELPIELKTRFPELPVICDPSHISGTTQYIKEVSQKALDLNMDGLMIETHINPLTAKSDANQQLKPTELKDLIKNLIVRSKNGYSMEFASLLEKYRDQIDSIDSQIIELLSKRLNIVKEIGIYKNKHNVTILDIKRWREIIRTRTQMASELNLPRDFIKKIMEIVHKASIQKQTEIMKKTNDDNKSNH